MKTKYADMHVHTNFSDSTFSPSEVVELAKREGLDAISITDHDSVEGIPVAILHASKLGIEVIPGIEITIEKDLHEIHILGYFIDWQAEWFRDKIKIMRDSRIERMQEMIRLLKNEGIEVDFDDVMKIAGKGSLGRLHLAKTMMKAEKISTIQEAFRKYIGFKKSCYVPHMVYSPKEAIGMILQAGGVPVLAHPKLIGKDEMISGLIDCGLRGIEVYHSDHDKQTEKKYLKIAQKRKLLVTGGSDCHGLGKDRVLIGSVKIDYELVTKIKEEAIKIKDNNLLN